MLRTSATLIRITKLIVICCVASICVSLQLSINSKSVAVACPVTGAEPCNSAETDTKNAAADNNYFGAIWMIPSSQADKYANANTVTVGIGDTTVDVVIRGSIYVKGVTMPKQYRTSAENVRQAEAGDHIGSNDGPGYVRDTNTLDFSIYSSPGGDPSNRWFYRSCTANSTVKNSFIRPQDGCTGYDIAANSEARATLTVGSKPSGTYNVGIYRCFWGAEGTSPGKYGQCYVQKINITIVRVSWEIHGATYVRVRDSNTGTSTLYTPTGSCNGVSDDFCATAASTIQKTPTATARPGDTLTWSGYLINRGSGASGNFNFAKAGENFSDASFNGTQAGSVYTGAGGYSVGTWAQEYGVAPWDFPGGHHKEDKVTYTVQPGDVGKELCQYIGWNGWKSGDSAPRYSNKACVKIEGGWSIDTSTSVRNLSTNVGSTSTEDTVPDASPGQVIRWTHTISNAGPKATDADVTPSLGHGANAFTGTLYNTTYTITTPTATTTLANKKIASGSASGASQEFNEVFTVRSADFGKTLCSKVNANPVKGGGATSGGLTAKSKCVNVPNNWVITPNISIRNNTQGSTAAHPSEWALGRDETTPSGSGLGTYEIKVYPGDTIQWTHYVNTTAGNPPDVEWGYESTSNTGSNNLKAGSDANDELGPVGGTGAEKTVPSTFDVPGDAPDGKRYCRKTYVADASYSSGNQEGRSRELCAVVVNKWKITPETTLKIKDSDGTEITAADRIKPGDANTKFARPGEKAQWVYTAKNIGPTQTRPLTSTASAAGSEISAADYSGLWRTGVDNNNVKLAQNKGDPHWSIVGISRSSYTNVSSNHDTHQRFQIKDYLPGDVMSQCETNGNTFSYPAWTVTEKGSNAGQVIMSSLDPLVVGNMAHAAVDGWSGTSPWGVTSSKARWISGDVYGQHYDNSGCRDWSAVQIDAGAAPFFENFHLKQTNAFTIDNSVNLDTVSLNLELYVDNTVQIKINGVPMMLQMKDRSTNANVGSPAYEVEPGFGGNARKVTTVPNQKNSDGSTIFKNTGNIIEIIVGSNYSHWGILIPEISLTGKKRDTTGTVTFTKIHTDAWTGDNLPFNPAKTWPAGTPVHTSWQPIGSENWSYVDGDGSTKTLFTQDNVDETYCSALRATPGGSELAVATSAAKCVNIPYHYVCTAGCCVGGCGSGESTHGGAEPHTSNNGHSSIEFGGNADFTYTITNPAGPTKTRPITYNTVTFIIKNGQTPPDLNGPKPYTTFATAKARVSGFTSKDISITANVASGEAVVQPAETVTVATASFDPFATYTFSANLGDRICSYLVINRWSVNNGVDSGNVSASNIACATVSKSPQLNLRGADSRSGATQFGKTPLYTGTNPSAPGALDDKYLGGFTGSLSTNALRGSWSQYGLISNGPITHFGSTGYTFDMNKTKACKLLFANSTTGGGSACTGNDSNGSLDVGGKRVITLPKVAEYSSTQIDDLVAAGKVNGRAFSTTSSYAVVTLNDLSSGTYYISQDTIIKASNLKPNQHIVLVAPTNSTKSITIAGNITANGTYASLKEIPSLTVIANKIYVSGYTTTDRTNFTTPAVEKIFGTYIARDSFSSCSLKTSASLAGTDFNLSNGNTTGLCNKQLAITGAVISKERPNFLRTFGAGRDDASVPSEILQYTPSNYLTPYALNHDGDSNAWDLVDLRQLPARL